MTKLILFDVDQTLIDALEHHDAGYRKAFKEVFNVDAHISEIKFAGKIIPNIIRELAELKGVPKDSVESRMEEAIEKTERYAMESVERGDVMVLEGARELLGKLKERGHVLGVLTGSPKDVTLAALRKAGIEDFFDLFVFGSEGKDRVELVGVAISKAGRFGKFSGKDVVIVGDSVHDIDCGKPHGALTVAVATGFHTREELLEHSPDQLFKDLTDPKILDVLR